MTTQQYMKELARNVILLNLNNKGFYEMKSLSLGVMMALANSHGGALMGQGLRAMKMANISDQSYIGKKAKNKSKKSRKQRKSKATK